MYSVTIIYDGLVIQYMMEANELFELEGKIEGHDRIKIVNKFRLSATLCRDVLADLGFI